MQLEDRSRLQVWSRLAALVGIMCLLSRLSKLGFGF
jgi:hypothetical protein